ncbi:MAG: thiamine phosphate synthase [Candidatus Omnitrophota bacterium]
MKDFNLYVIIGGKDLAGGDLADIAKRAVRGGADVIQLREKQASARDIVRLGLVVKKAIQDTKALFIINDRPDIALAVGADGVHLGQDDLPVEAARLILGKDKIIGLSTHSIAQALEAQKRGADYIGVGPIFSTPTKPDYKPVGLNLVKQVKNKVNIPFVAIGGIDETNIDEVVDAGACRVAVVRAVCRAKDVEAAARSLKERLKKI